MDAEYLGENTLFAEKTDRLFDGGHDPILAWKKVKSASDTEYIFSRSNRYVSGIWKDVSTPKGIPFVTLDKITMIDPQTG